MRIALVHNPSAGQSQHSEAGLLRLVQTGGHQVTLLSTSTNLSRQTSEKLPGARFDLMAVAGGDGTVEKTVRHFYDLLCEHGIPLAIIPMGTANNIAASLGIGSPAKTLVASWPTALKKDLFVGLAHRPKGLRRFIESVGMGPLASLIHLGQKKEEQEARRSRDSNPNESGPLTELAFWRSSLTTLISTAEASVHRVFINERDYSGRYLLVEVMNIPRAGPGLLLAPELRADEEGLVVVLIRAEAREHLVASLNQGLNSTDLALQLAEGISCVPARIVELPGTARPFHIDDKLYRAEESGSITLRTEPKPLTVLY